MLAALDRPGVRLINTLSEADFKGEEPSRYGRPGRIPGSVNLPWPGLTDPETHRFIPLDEAAQRIEAIGAPGAERIVCYCGGGISATRACSCCTAWATPTSPFTTPRWPNGRATRTCRSSAG